jgi:hypothetical protein
MLLTGETKLIDLIKAGADRLGDIPLNELIAYIRRECLKTAADSGTPLDEEFLSQFCMPAILADELATVYETIRHPSEGNGPNQ